MTRSDVMNDLNILKLMNHGYKIYQFSSGVTVQYFSLKNDSDFVIEFDLCKRTVCKYWCDCPVEFLFSEILVISDFIFKHLGE